MSQEQIEIHTQPRNLGKHHSRAYRRGRQVPAVVYGPKIKNMVFNLSELEATRYSSQAYENTIFVLKSEDSKLNGLKVLKKSTEVNPLSQRPVHMDFFAVDMEQTVRVPIEIVFEGKAAGIRDGGVLNISRRDVEVECLPSAIPQCLTIDVSGLQLNENIHVSDLVIPEGVKLLTAGSETLAVCAQPKEEVASEAGAGEGGAAEASTTEPKK